MSSNSETSGKAERVDVLAVMRHMVRMHEIEGGDERYEPGHEAIAAVAELIEQVYMLDELYEAGCDVDGPIMELKLIAERIGAAEEARAAIARAEGEGRD